MVENVSDFMSGIKICEMLDSRLSKHVAEDGKISTSLFSCYLYNDSFCSIDF